MLVVAYQYLPGKILLEGDAKVTETTEALLPTAPSKRKQKHAGAHVQFFMDRALYKRMQAHAKSEGITTVGWIRRAAIKELRRSKAAA